MRGNKDSFKKRQILQPNANKSSDILQNSFNNTKLVDYGFLFMTKL